MRAAVCLAALVVGCSTSARSKPSEDERSEPETASASLATHPFWRTKITKVDIDKIVDQVVKSDEKTILFLRSDGKAVLSTDSEDRYMLREFPGHYLSRDVLALDMSGFGRRPTEKEVRRALRGEMDKAEFRAVSPNKGDVTPFRPEERRKHGPFDGPPPDKAEPSKRTVIR